MTEHGKLVKLRQTYRNKTFSTLTLTVASQINDDDEENSDAEKTFENFFKNMCTASCKQKSPSKQCLLLIFFSNLHNFSRRIYFC